MIAERGGSLFAQFNPHHFLYMPSLRISYLLAAPFCSACDGIVIGRFIARVGARLVLHFTFDKSLPVQALPPR
jgi:hypothetical protein